MSVIPGDELFFPELIFPFTSVIQGLDSGLSELVIVRPTVKVALVDQPLIYENVEIRIQTSVIQLHISAFFHFFFNTLTGRHLKTRDHIQQVALESSQVE